MKRYVKASIFDAYEGISKRLTALKHDFKMLAKCDSLEDVKNTEWMSWNISRFISRDIEKGQLKEDAIDNMLDFLHEQIVECKKDLEDAQEYEDKCSGLMNNLSNSIASIYDVIDVSDEYVLVQPFEGANHKDCIQFVDHVVSLLGCKFSGTARGGSWTQWDLITDTGVKLKAGWSDSFDSRRFNVPQGVWIVRLQ